MTTTATVVSSLTVWSLRRGSLFSNLCNLRNLWIMS